METLRRTYKMCLNPKWVYKKGRYKEDNYRGMAGDPYELGTYSKCGTCEICIAEKSNNWVVRNWYESQSQEKKCFITLTYRENPIILVKKDFQDFMKRLRQYLSYHGYKQKIRAFICGEYGELSGRPHGHIIIYGWQDDNAQYLGINKKKQIYYKSDIIEKCWSLGRTSYQPFGNHEIPYISLYNTPAEEFCKAYKMNRKKLKEVEEYARSNARMDDKQRKNLQDELKRVREEMDESKAKYKLIKEFNTWSQGLGWEKFFEEYSKSNNYAWVEYIEDKEFATPSPWTKKLANMGFVDAIEEMHRREKLMAETLTEEEERIKNNIRVMEKRKKEIKEWLTDKKQGLEYI